MADAVRDWRLKRDTHTTHQVGTDASLAQRISLLEQQMVQVIAHLKHIDAEGQQFMAIAQALDARITSLRPEVKAA